MASEPSARSESFAVFIPEFERLIADVMEEWKVPGLAVVVVQSGEVAFVKPYGLRDVEAGLKATTDTQFQVMSVSKSFAATGLALLVDEGRMDWKKPVREYIPEFRLHDDVATDRLTVRDLLCHHSGFAESQLVMATRRSVACANAGGNALFGAERRHSQQLSILES